MIFKSSNYACGSFGLVFFVQMAFESDLTAKHIDGFFSSQMIALSLSISFFNNGILSNPPTSVSAQM
ncbi:hypothetical protein FGO68_gene10640 [Halteria grandinella]|uniref:Uncharacterized protein n=1 Tax=Halteria grandinella TaxID=5974 RepID=A0A8J8P088_HALGN|nr:hypothetical protein FGO68_gene10640 [Halteria grandinella]